MLSERGAGGWAAERNPFIRHKDLSFLQGAHMAFFFLLVLPLNHERKALNTRFEFLSPLKNYP